MSDVFLTRQAHHFTTDGKIAIFTHFRHGGTAIVYLREEVRLIIWFPPRPSHPKSSSEGVELGKLFRRGSERLKLDSFLWSRRYQTKQMLSFCGTNIKSKETEAAARNPSFMSRSGKAGIQTRPTKVDFQLHFSTLQRGGGRKWVGMFVCMRLVLWRMPQGKAQTAWKALLCCTMWKRNSSPSLEQKEEGGGGLMFAETEENCWRDDFYFANIWVYIASYEKCRTA